MNLINTLFLFILIAAIPRFKACCCKNAGTDSEGEEDEEDVVGNRLLQHLEPASSKDVSRHNNSKTLADSNDSAAYKEGIRKNSLKSFVESINEELEIREDYIVMVMDLAAVPKETAIQALRSQNGDTILAIAELNKFDMEKLKEEDVEFVMDKTHSDRYWAMWALKGKNYNKFEAVAFLQKYQ